MESGRDVIDKGMQILVVGLCPYITRELSWVRFSPEERTDPSKLLKRLRDHWESVFCKTLKKSCLRYIEELLETRNKWAHFNNELDIDDAERALDNMTRLLAGVGAGRQADEVRDIRAAVLKNRLEDLIPASAVEVSDGAADVSLFTQVLELLQQHGARLEGIEQKLSVIPIQGELAVQEKAILVASSNAESSIVPAEVDSGHDDSLATETTAVAEVENPAPLSAEFVELSEAPEEPVEAVAAALPEHVVESKPSVTVIGLVRELGVRSTAEVLALLRRAGVDVDADGFDILSRIAGDVVGLLRELVKQDVAAKAVEQPAEILHETAELQATATAKSASVRSSGKPAVRPVAKYAARSEITPAGKPTTEQIARSNSRAKDELPNKRKPGGMTEAERLQRMRELQRQDEEEAAALELQYTVSDTTHLKSGSSGKLELPRWQLSGPGYRDGVQVVNKNGRWYEWDARAQKTKGTHYSLPELDEIDTSAPIGRTVKSASGNRTCTKLKPVTLAAHPPANKAIDTLVDIVVDAIAPESSRLSEWDAWQEQMKRAASQRPTSSGKRLYIGQLVNVGFRFGNEQGVRIYLSAYVDAEGNPLKDVYISLKDMVRALEAMRNGLVYQSAGGEFLIRANSRKGTFTVIRAYRGQDPRRQGTRDYYNCQFSPGLRARIEKYGSTRSSRW